MNCNRGKHFIAGVFSLIVLIETCYIVLTGWSFGKVKGTEWFVSSCVTFLAVLFIYEPLKILVIASYRTFVNKNTYGHVSNIELDLPATSYSTKLKERCNRLCFMLRKSLYEPISLQDQDILREKVKKEDEKEALASELMLIALFLLSLTILVLSIYHSLSFFSSENIKNHFVEGKFSAMGLKSIISDDDLKFYLDNNFLKTIHYGKDEKGKIFTDGNGWISEGYVRMLGVPRLRQLRARKKNCEYQDCVEEYSEDSQESRDFSVGWKLENSQKYQKKFHRIRGPWKFVSSASSIRYFGIHSYPGSGFVSKLGRTGNNSDTIWQFLTKNSWIDRQTKAFFIETTFYSVDSGIFNVMTLALERSPFGNWIATSEIKTSNFLVNLYDMKVLLPLVLFLSLLGIFTWKTAIKVKNIKFFKQVWNIADIIIITVSIALVISMILRNAHVKSLINELKTSRNNEFVSFSYVAFHDSATTAIAGFLIFITTIRLWKILNFSRRFRSLNLTMYYASESLMSIACLLVILLLGFSSTVYIINGSHSELFSTYPKTMTALMAHSLGFSRVIHDVDLMYGGRILGVTINALFMGLFNFFLLNIFTTIVLIYIKKTREEMKKDPPDVKIMQVIVKKFRKMFGWAPENELEFFHREYTMERAHHITRTIDAHVEFLEKYLQDNSDKS